MTSFRAEPQTAGQTTPTKLPSSVPAGAGQGKPAQESGRFTVAICIPCHNEEQTVGKVVSEFHAALPHADIFVYDNASDDDTAAVAAQAGATVRHIPTKGNGHVIRRMLADIDADAYLLVDGDGAHDPDSAARMVDLVRVDGYDLVNAARLDDGPTRPGHDFGNRVLTGLVEVLFHREVADMLSGYKALSRRFAKSFPVFSAGFEIETEITVHALELGMPIADIEAPCRSRPEGSVSKLKTYSDGWKILQAIFNLVRQERPLAFFSALGALFAVVAIVLAIPLLITFIHTSKVPRFPTAILSTGLMILASLSLASGFILDTVTRGRREAKVLGYLSHPGPLANSPR